MLLSAINPDELIRHIVDHPWPNWYIEPFGIRMTLMSSGIFTMLLVTAVLLVGLPLMARRISYLPRGGQNILEILLIFIRDMVGRPALQEKAEPYVPFLASLFVFIFALNLIGLVPLEAATLLLGVQQYKIGGTPTAVATISGALASAALFKLLVSGLRRSAQRFHHHHDHWPWWLCLVLSPGLWFVSLAPAVPGLIGKAILVPLALLELASALAKCMALMVRLCANMVAGHMMLAVVLWLAMEALKAILQQTAFHAVYVVPLCVAASVALDVMEILVAAIQAFIFTLMTGMFLGMYAEAEH